MIARYTHPEMGRIWSDQRRYETWLLVETAAAEAMAAAGIVPAEAARDIRERGALRHRAHRGDRADHPARRHRVHDRRRRAGRAVGALAALRHDLVGRHRHRAGAADARGVRPHPARISTRSPTPIRDRAFEHRRTPMIGRTHGVHAEPMTFGLKLALWYAEIGRDIERVRRARDGRQRRQAVGRRRHVRAPAAVDRGRCLPAARARAGAGRLAGHPARSARRAAVGARDHRRVAREVRARDPRPAEDRDRRGRGAVRQGPEGLVGDAAQAQPDRLRADRRPGAAASRATATRRSRTSRCGTSATSRTPRSSA